jgi:hypothetical protein
VELPEGEGIEFRFLITDPCQGFSVDVPINFGMYAVYIKYGEPASPSSYDYSSTSKVGAVEYFSCPGGDLFHLGTWFVFIRGNIFSINFLQQAVYDASFKIGVTLQPLPPLDPSPPSCSLPSEYESTHECLQDSVPHSQTCDQLG